MKAKKLSVPDSDAVFIGWQKTRLGDVIGLYNVTKASHPLYGSTVSVDTLKKLNLQPPTKPGSESSGKRRILGKVNSTYLKI